MFPFHDKGLRFGNQCNETRSPSKGITENEISTWQEREVTCVYHKFRGNHVVGFSRHDGIAHVESSTGPKKMKTWHWYPHLWFFVRFYVLFLVHASVPLSMRFLSRCRERARARARLRVPGKREQVVGHACRCMCMCVWVSCVLVSRKRAGSGAYIRPAALGNGISLQHVAPIAFRKWLRMHVDYARFFPSLHLCLWSRRSLPASRVFPGNCPVAGKAGVQLAQLETTGFIMSRQIESTHWDRNICKFTCMLLKLISFYCSLPGEESVFPQISFVSPTRTSFQM